MKRKLVILFVILSLITNLIYCGDACIASDSHASDIASSATILDSSAVVDDAPSSLSISDEVEVYADSCLLLEANTSKILYEKNAYNRMYPASTTKLMTAILVLEKCEDLSQHANVSYYAVHSVPYTYSIVPLQPKESFSLKDLLYALLIPSANDAAYVLAEYVVNGGNNYPLDASSQSKASFENSIDTFSNMMNEKAKELGCLNTNFVNPNGIHDENHYSTSYDLALIGKYAYENQTLRSIVNTLSYTFENTEYYNDDIRNMNSSNWLINPKSKNYYEYANGLKTGYTDAAQSCIVASAKKDGIDLIVSLLHSPKTTDANASRESDCIRLFEYGFKSVTNSVLVNNKDVIKNISIINGTSETRSLNVLANSDLSAIIKVGETIDITPDVNITKFLAPIAKDEIIGYVTYSIDGISYTADLIAEHDVVPDDYMQFIWMLLTIFAILLLMFTILFNKKKRRRKRR